MTVTGKNFIGQSPSSKGEKVFSGTGNVENPIHRFSDATAEETDSAVQLAATAFESYHALPAAVRAAFLEKIALHVAASRTLLREMGCRETGLGEQRLEGELNRTINQINMFVALLREGSWVNAIIDTALPDRQPLPKPDIRQQQIPVGVVGVFGASNFPFAFSVAGGDTVAALAAGCTVVYKAHPGHPATSELTTHLILKAAAESGMPDGVFSLLQGEGREAGEHLVKHPLVKAIAFTGSLAGGRALYNAAAMRDEPIPVYAEMGSTNPVIILPEMMQQQHAALAKSLAASNILSAGQFCTNPGVIFSLQSDEATEFLTAFTNIIRDATPEIMLTGGIHAAYTKGLETFARKTDVQVITKGVPNSTKREALPGVFRTTVREFLASKEIQEELFGPASLHVVARSREELASVIRNFHGQLTFSVWGTENDMKSFAAEISQLALKGGRIICNSVPTGVEVTHAMVHGGPYPATTDSKFTSVGSQSIYRFTRPVAFQNFPAFLLPEALRNENPSRLWRKINGTFSNQSIS